MLCDRDPLRRGNRIGVGAGSLGDDRNANRIGVGRCRADIAPRRLDAAADAAEQIDFISNVEAEIDLHVGRASAPANRDAREAPVLAALPPTPTCGSRAPRSSRRIARALAKCATATRISVFDASASATSPSSTGSSYSRHHLPVGWAGETFAATCGRDEWPGGGSTDRLGHIVRPGRASGESQRGCRGKQ